MRRRLDGPTALVPAGATGADVRRLEQVVSVRFPVRAATTWLRRQVSHDVRIRLVELERGERVGLVRAVEVRHAGGLGRSLVRAERKLPDGSPAGAFVPDHQVRREVVVEGPLASSRVLTRGDVIVLHVPVQGWTRFLPGVLRGDGPVTVRSRDAQNSAFARAGGGGPVSGGVEEGVDGDALRRMLLVFQHLATGVNDRVDRLAELTDPLRCDPSLLPWLAAWVGFELDGALPLDQQRELVRRAIRLYRTRGTRSGIEEMVSVLTTAPVRIVERARPTGVVLGRTHLSGGSDAPERWRRSESRAAHLHDRADASPSAAARRASSFFELRLEAPAAFRERFGERAPDVIARIIAVASRERPAHIWFTLRFEEGA